MKNLAENLSRGILVDKEFLFLLEKNLWTIRKGEKKEWASYAVAVIDKKMVRLHHLIIGKKPGKVVDHKNCNGLDNRLENLRFVTHSQNIHNTKSFIGVSKFKGVALGRSKSKPWRAYITLNRKTKFLGHFKTEQEAALAYNYHAKILHKDFAVLNAV